MRLRADIHSRLDSIIPSVPRMSVSARTILPKRPPIRHRRLAGRPPRGGTRKPKLRLRPAAWRIVQRQVHGDSSSAGLRNRQNRDWPMDTRRRTPVGRGDCSWGLTGLAARLCGRDARAPREANGVPKPLDSRFRGNDGVEIGNGGAIIVHFGLMSTRPSAPAIPAPPRNAILPHPFPTAFRSMRFCRSP